ncbi:unnamed protein product [Prunus armeniaca]
MELSEIEKLREETGRSFRLQASASVDMWLCMKRAKVDKHAKRAYNVGRAKVAEVGKVLQDHANLVKDKEALEWQVKAAEDKLTEMRETLEAMVAITKESEAATNRVQVVLEEVERSQMAEIEVPVKEVVRQYCLSKELTFLLDKEVG